MTLTKGRLSDHILTNETNGNRERQRSYFKVCCETVAALEIYSKHLSVGFRALLSTEINVFTTTKNEEHTVNLQLLYCVRFYEENIHADLLTAIRL